MIAFAVLALAAQAADGPVEIPREFWGEFNSSLEDCGTWDNDSLLHVTKDEVRFFASTGQVYELLEQPDGSLVVVALHSGEGEVWTSVYQFRLSPDASILTTIYPQTELVEQFSFDRLRCSESTE
jgi:hypothetical protein